VKIKEINILVFVLLAHAIASLFTGYYENSSIHPGTIRGALVTVFVIYFVIRNIKFKNIINVTVILYLVYLGMLPILSSNFNTSFYHYIGVFVSISMLPIGYYYINSIEKLYLLSKTLLFILIIFTSTVLISNAFGIGRSDYLDGSFYFGYGRVNITKTMVILLFVTPIYFTLEKSKRMRSIAMVFAIITLVICLIGIKRTVLASVIISPFIFYIFGPSLKHNTKYLLFIFVLLIPFIPLYGEIFEDRLDSRSERLTVSDETLNTEARYHEVNLVINTMKKEGWRHLLFGSDIFNDREFFGVNRMLHTDYMIILNGAGILGFIGWFLIFYIVIHLKIKFYKNIKKTNVVKVMNAVFWLLIITQLLMSISGTVYDISLRSYLLVVIGGILGTMKNINKSRI